jgi:hypothetical protein
MRFDVLIRAGEEGPTSNDGKEGTVLVVCRITPIAVERDTSLNPLEQLQDAVNLAIVAAVGNLQQLGLEVAGKDSHPACRPGSKGILCRSNLNCGQPVWRPT